MEKWRAWFKDLGEKGYLKDIGHPLEHLFVKPCTQLRYAAHGEA
jgi:hypothetical protein